jgi:hypothetical protein
MRRVLEDQLEGSTAAVTAVTVMLLAVLKLKKNCSFYLNRRTFLTMQHFDMCWNETNPMHC